MPLALPNWTYVLDLLALVGALGYWYVARNREARPSLTWTWLVSALSILIGLFMAFSVIGLHLRATTLFTRLGLVCFAWVALIQPPGKPDEGTQFARLLLPPLAVLQALHAFPVAGSQVFWSALLLIPVGALCIANGVRWIAFSLGGQSARRAPFAIGAIAATVAMVVLVSIQLKQGLDQVRAAYGGSVSLGLPGAEDVRVSPEKAANYQAIVAAIDENCESFVTLPGMNSFYLWTQQEPPAGYKPTDLDNAVGRCTPAEGDRSHPLDRRPLPARKRPAGPVVGCWRRNPARPAGSLPAPWLRADRKVRRLPAPQARREWQPIVSTLPHSLVQATGHPSRTT